MINNSKKKNSKTINELINNKYSIISNNKLNKGS